MQLRELSNPPASLYVLGTIPTAPMVAIVGTRRPTSYGRQVTYQLASELARAGVVIVSGLASGIDGTAHQGAIDSGGKTVAVQACGLDMIYPSDHRKLATEILATGGAIISEYEVGTQPLPHQFVLRNRIIAGLAVATIVTEAAEKSGSLITANYALAENRLVMAVPGNITAPGAAGPNNLLRAGAMPITSAADVMVALNFETGAVADIPVSAQSAEEAKILDLLRSGATSSDNLIELGGFEASQFANIISLMEITGKVRNLGAGLWAPRS